MGPADEALFPAVLEFIQGLFVFGLSWQPQMTVPRGR